MASPLFVHTWKSGQRRHEQPIVCLHGFTGSGCDFEPIARSFACVALDLIGHGNSPKPMQANPYSFAEQVEAIWQTVQEQQLQRTILLGYSMGGRLALQLACTKPQAFSGLVLIGASAGLRSESQREIRRRADHELAANIEQKGSAWFRQHWSQQPIIQSQQRIPDPWQASMQQRRQSNTSHALAMTLRQAGTGSMQPLWDQLPALSLPTLLITGCDDTKFGAIASEMSALMPRAQHVQIERAGHCAHLENMDGFSAALQRFLPDWDEHPLNG